MIPDALLVARLACAILALQPSREPERAQAYATVHIEMGRKHKLAPVLLAAVAETETNHRHRRVGDHGTAFGLYQIRCSEPWCRVLRGDLLRAADLGAAELAKERARYGGRRCCRTHPWYAHHKWGGIVRTTAYGSKIAATRERIERLLAGRCHNPEASRVLGPSAPVDRSESQGVGVGGASREPRRLDGRPDPAPTHPDF